MKTSPRILLLVVAAMAIVSTASTAAIRNSVTYSVPLEVLDSGGREVSSVSYTSIGSLGGIAGTAAAPTTQAVFGIIGQIDIQPPEISLPAPIITASTDPAGTAVNFSIFATDDWDPNPLIVADPASGSIFPTGDTTVQVSATDNAGNRATGSFPVKVLSPLLDSDGDGLNDSAEFLMSSLGYDWQVSQPALVSTLLDNANVAGLFTQPQYAANRTNGQNDVINDPNAFSLYNLSQVQALHSGTPIIARDPGTGKFKLTMDWKKSTNLTDFFDFPAPAGSAVSINPQGDVELEFPSTDDAAFYRIEVD